MHLIHKQDFYKYKQKEIDELFIEYLVPIMDKVFNKKFISLFIVDIFFALIITDFYPEKFPWLWVKVSVGCIQTKHLGFRPPEACGRP